MKHIIILGDGMADWHRDDLGGKTLLQYADTPHMDWLAEHGRSGLLRTVQEGFHPGSEVANSSILGYDQRKVYEGRGPLETEEGDTLIRYLEKELGNDRVHFYTGVQYRHLLVIKGGDKRVSCTPPHDVPLQTWEDKLPKAECPEAEDTARLLCKLIRKSQELLPGHPLNLERSRKGLDMATSIWPWGGGYRPNMEPLTQTYPQIRRGAVITAVDLIRGIGTYAGLRVINVDGATGLWDTNYEAKAKAAIDALRTDDFVYVHVEASDEAGHDGDLQLKLKTIENLDHRLIAPILEATQSEDFVKECGDRIAVALLPDHPTPVAHRTHTADPVPFTIYAPGMEKDNVMKFDEDAAKDGAYGLLEGKEFIEAFMKV